jgi:hypothetical protein
MANSYLPGTDTGRMQWLNNFAAKLPNYKDVLALTDATLNQYQDDAENFAYIIGGIESFRKYTKQATAFKNLMRSGSPKNDPLGAPPPAPETPVLPKPAVPDIFGRVTKTVQVIKNTEGYNEAIGKDLGIIGEETAKMQADMKPVLGYEMQAGQPNIKWKKQGMQGIHIYADRGDGKGYSFLATDTQPDYLDTYPLPATGQAVLWKYKAIYIDHDDETGQISDEMVVSVSGKL